MIVFSAAHQSSKGLSVPNEKSARHIDMKIILWIFYRFFQIHRRRSRIDMPKPYGVIMDFSRTHRGRCPIDMTPSLSDWYDKDPIEMMDDLSFQYDWWPVILIRFTDSFWIHYGDISLSYRDETTQISYGLFLDWWWARLILIWPKAVVLIWLDARFRIEMIRIEMMSALVLICLSHSYWYDPLSRIDMWRERKILYPLLSLNRKVIFLIILTGKIEGH